MAYSPRIAFSASKARPDETMPSTRFSSARISSFSKQVSSMMIDLRNIAIDCSRPSGLISIIWAMK
ncbi:hypothetical protein D3C72_2466070 [compost metagenome]